LEKETEKKPPDGEEGFLSVDGANVDEIRPTNVSSIFEEVLGVSLEDSKRKPKE